MANTPAVRETTTLCQVLQQLLGHGLINVNKRILRRGALNNRILARQNLPETQMKNIPTAKETEVLCQVFRQLLGHGTTNVQLRILRRGVLITGYLPDGSLQRHYIPFEHVTAIQKIQNPSQN